MKVFTTTMPMLPSKKGRLASRLGGSGFFLKIVVEYFRFFATVPHPEMPGPGPSIELASKI